VSATVGVARSTVTSSARSAAGTPAVAMATLFAVTRSGVAALTEAVSAMTRPAAAAVTRARRVNVAWPDGASVPTPHWPVADTQPPTVAPAETNASPAGRRFVTVTPPAAFGPAFVTCTVQVRVSPTFGAGGLNDT